MCAFNRIGLIDMVIDHPGGVEHETDFNSHNPSPIFFFGLAIELYEGAF